MTFVLVAGAVCVVAAGLIMWLLDRLYWVEFELKQVKRAIYDQQHGRPAPSDWGARA